MSQTDHYLKEKKKKAIGLMNKELGGKIMKDFAVLRAKAYKYLTYNHDDNKNTKGKKGVPSNENVDLKIIYTVQKQIIFKIE